MLAAIALAGCTYPEFAFTTGAGDAAVDDGVTAEVSTDTSAPDEGPRDTLADAPDAPETLADALTDSADATADAPAETGCTGSTADFCEDWDEATTARAGFTGTNVAAKGAIALDPSGGRSAPNAFLATTSPDPDASVVVANLDRAFTGPSPETPVRVDAWIKLETATFPTTGSGAFLLKLQRDGGPGDGVTFSIDDVGFYVDRIGNTYAAYPLPTKPKVDAWMHVRLDVVLHTTNGRIVAWVDDMVTPVLSISSVSTVRADVSGRRLIVGLFSQNATGTFRARYDDVSLEFR